jgi:hypothetical protein
MFCNTQCCGAETICFRSGFQKVSAPTIALELPVITDFILKSTVFMFFMKEYWSNSQARSYSKWIFIFIYYFSWPGAETSIFRLRLQPKFWLLATPAQQTLAIPLKDDNECKILETAGNFKVIRASEPDSDFSIIQLLATWVSWDILIAQCAEENISQRGVSGKFNHFQCL